MLQTITWEKYEQDPEAARSWALRSCAGAGLLPPVVTTAPWSWPMSTPFTSPGTPLSMPGGLSGGAFAGGGSGANTNSSSAAPAPSCRSMQFPGSHGVISVQTNPQGYVAWGIYMYNPIADTGPWHVNVFVGARRVDAKSPPRQIYAPHGSVNPVDAKSGSTFRIDAKHNDLIGLAYVNVPNSCIIP